MSTQTRGAAKATFGNGEELVCTFDKSIPTREDEAHVLAEVMRVCLLGDIVSVEPIQIEALTPEA